MDNNNSEFEKAFPGFKELDPVPPPPQLIIFRLTVRNSDGIDLYEDNFLIPRFELPSQYNDEAISIISIQALDALYHGKLNEKIVSQCGSIVIEGITDSSFKHFAVIPDDIRRSLTRKLKRQRLISLENL